MRRAAPALDRQSALKARPTRVPALRTEHREGKLHVTVQFIRPGWQRFLGADKLCERTFGLDAYGQEVYGLCDGQLTTEKLVKSFARSHQLSLAEAQVSVTTFLKTLLTKGLIVMQVERLFKDKADKAR